MKSSCWAEEWNWRSCSYLSGLDFYGRIPSIGDCWRRKEGCDSTFVCFYIGGNSSLIGHTVLEQEIWLSSSSFHLSQNLVICYVNFPLLDRKLCRYRDTSLASSHHSMNFNICTFERWFAIYLGRVDKAECYDTVQMRELRCE